MSKAFDRPDDGLTILLPLKGRDLFTLRFLYHANLCRLPFRILIADGWVNPRLADLLEQKARLWPHVRYTYIRYPNDDSRSLYYRKMADAAARVATPYVVQADNDDFLCLSGIERCVVFLDTMPGHVTCGGGIGAFMTAPQRSATWNKVVGGLIHLTYRYPGHDLGLDADSCRATERVLHAYEKRKTAYYDVFRVDALKTILREIVELDPCDSMIHERYFDLRALTLGKKKLLPGIFTYMRQMGTSIRLTFGEDDLVTRMLRGHFMQDHDRMVTRISDLCAEADGDVDRDFVVEELRRIFGAFLRRRLRRQNAPKSLLRSRLAPFVPHWLRRLRHHGHLTAATMRREVFQRLRADGADPAYVERFAQEMKTIDEVLEGTRFKAFVHEHAPFLLA